MKRTSDHSLDSPTTTTDTTATTIAYLPRLTEDVWICVCLFIHHPSHLLTLGSTSHLLRNITARFVFANPVFPSVRSCSRFLQLSHYYPLVKNLFTTDNAQYTPSTTDIAMILEGCSNTLQSLNLPLTFPVSVVDHLSFARLREVTWNINSPECTQTLLKHLPHSVRTLRVNHLTTEMLMKLLRVDWVEEFYFLPRFDRDDEMISLFSTWMKKSAALRKIVNTFWNNAHRWTATSNDWLLLDICVTHGKVGLEFESEIMISPATFFRIPKHWNLEKAVSFFVQAGFQLKVVLNSNILPNKLDKSVLIFQSILRLVNDPLIEMSAAIPNIERFFLPELTKIKHLKLISRRILSDSLLSVVFLQFPLLVSLTVVENVMAVIRHINTLHIKHLCIYERSALHTSQLDQLFSELETLIFWLDKLELSLHIYSRVLLRSMIQLMNKWNPPRPTHIHLELYSSPLLYNEEDCFGLFRSELLWWNDGVTQLTFTVK